MRFHYLLYFEAEENISHNIFSQEEPLNSSLTKYFLKSSLYELQNKKIFDNLKEELVDIIQVIEFFKIELNLNLNNSEGFKFFVLHFTSDIELYHLIGDKYLPIGNEVDKLLDKLNSKIYRNQDIIHTRRFLVNTYIPPNLRNEIRDAAEDVIQNSEKSEFLIFHLSWQEYPFIIEFQHNFSSSFDEKFTKLIKNYIIEKLSIDHVNWDVHILDFSNRGIIMCPDKDIDFEKVSELISEAFIQNFYGIYTRISDYFRLYQQKLLNLDEILPKLNYSEYLSNLKLLKVHTFGEFPLLYLQEIDRILLQTSEDSVERLDPPISEIFDNSAFGYNIYDKVRGAYLSLKDELNSVIATLQIIISQKHAEKDTVEEELEEKEKLVEHEKLDTSTSKEHRIPNIIIQAIEKSIEISKKCVSEEGRVSPKVGAVLIKGNKIFESAYRGEIEVGDHAEYTLLEKKLKSKDLNNTILITTLEPCTRRSSNKTSCAERIVQAGIRQVWIGITDPNPDISTRGCTYLRMKNVSINYFPDKYAQKILEMNKEFWENETKKYKHDVMLIPDHDRKDLITISSERLKKIEEKLEIRKKDETKKEKEQKSPTQYLSEPELENNKKSINLFKEAAMDLVQEVNQTNINISTILPKYLNFLYKTNNKEEAKWIQAEISGDIQRLAEENQDLFNYRIVHGYMSPFKFNFMFNNLDIFISNPKNLLKPFDVVLTFSLSSIEEIRNDPSKIGVVTLSKNTIESYLKEKNLSFENLYFYFKGSEVLSLIRRIRQKISSFLIKFLN